MRDMTQAEASTIHRALNATPMDSDESVFEFGKVVGAFTGPGASTRACLCECVRASVQVSGSGEAGVVLVWSQPVMTCRLFDSAFAAQERRIAATHSRFAACAAPPTHRVQDYQSCGYEPFWSYHAQSLWTRAAWLTSG